MSRLLPPSHAADRLTSFFWSGDAMRSRAVSDIVLTGLVDIPQPPARLRADWARELSVNMPLDAGDVEAMPLARARMRWPEYGDCVGAVSAWADGLGLPGVLAGADIALMACRGARYHNDGEQYGGAAFCNLFLGEDDGQDVHFPALDIRVPIRRGTVLIFDTCQPHGVIRRGATGFDAADFPPGPPGAQLFLTWELPIEDAALAGALAIELDTEPAAARHLDEEQVWRNGERVRVSPDTGCWRAAG
ncbi:hypothetical protein K6V92_13910 [Cupriavidus respiraculi]|uniref:hypothetical protein n=1 Tax=Cupriavidus respiraculi TaxID=195930 RepID=UPI001C95D49C|nr:hypothetical protein [Cupriavidus respiraculi]MBY4947715.1 hypothetical protein [Cupriavidus respiraculi]